MGVSIAPSWQMAGSVRNALFEENEQGTIKGSEFAVGFVRGSSLGGDWGVSYVRKPWKDGSGITETNSECFDPAQTACRPRIESTLSEGVYLDAVEVHWFIRIANIKERLQVGANIAGGVGAVRGNVIKTTDRFEPTGFTMQGPTGFQPVHEVETLAAKDELVSKFPLFKVEAVGSFIVVPALKVQVAAGVNFPAYGARVGLVYLIGAK